MQAILKRQINLSLKNDTAMNKDHIDKIHADFDAEDVEWVIATLESITHEHVMAHSQINLDNTWSAILHLSKGDLNKLKELVDAAKVDFRDVIYWATLDNK